jgi:RNA-binding protein
MRFLGSVQEVTFEGKLIVRGSFAPFPKSRVLDNRQRPLGRVVRVFGPVDSPYVSVEPGGDVSLLSAVGKQVYVEEVENYAKTKGRDRRDRKMS